MDDQSKSVNWQVNLKYGIHSAEQHAILDLAAVGGIAAFSHGPCGLLYDAYSGSTQVFHYNSITITHNSGDFLLLSSEKSKLEELARNVSQNFEIKPAEKRFPQK